ncbi:MAG: WG repeat-containing protein [Bacteroidota bacterium]
MAFLLGNLASAQVLPVKVDRKWGLINHEGTLIATPVYDAIHEVAGDHAVVVKNGKYGLLDGNGKVLVEPQYTYLRALNDNLLLINKGGDCEEGDCQGGKWGLVHLESGAMLPPQFDFVETFNENGLARVNIGGDCGYSDCEDGRWGIVDSLAVLRLAPEFLRVQLGLTEDAFVKSDSGWGLFHLGENRMRIPPIFGELERIGRNRITMEMEGRYGVLTDDGDTLIAPQYEGVRDAQRGFLAYREGKKWGLMDSVGRHITTARFDAVRAEPHDWIKIRDANMWGLVDMQDKEKTKEVVGAVLRKVGHLGPDFATVQRGPRWGVIGRDGEFRVQVKYETMDVVGDSLFLVVDRKYHKWINKDGAIVKAVQFENPPEWNDRDQALVKVKGRYGLLNKAGTWLIPPRYEQIRLFTTVAKARIKKKWKYFYFDEEGRPSKVKRFVLMAEDEEEDIANINSVTIVGWFYSQSKQKWGLRDPNSNRVLIEPKYIRINLIPGTNLSTGYLEIPNSDQYGWCLVNHTRGREVTGPLFSKIFLDDFQNQRLGRAVYALSGKFGLIRSTGELVSFDGAAYIGPFQEGVARINVGGMLQWKEEPGLDTIASEKKFDRITRETTVRYQYCLKGSWGYIDTRGEWMKKASFETALDFENGVARVRQGGKWGVIDKNFDVVVKPSYDFIDNLYADDGTVLLTVGNDFQEFGFIDEKGEIAILPRFGEVGDFKEGLVRVRKDGLWGYADTNGNLVIQPQYKEAGDFFEGRARVRDKRYWGFIDKQGNPVTPQKYLRAGDFHGGLAWVQSDKFFGYIGVEGNMLIDPQYTQTGDFERGLAPARRKGKFGLIDTRGRWVVPPRFYKIHGFHDSIAVVQEMGNFGMVNPAGEFIVKPNYRHIGAFKEGLAAVRERLEFGYMNAQGKIRIPCQFANAKEFACGRAAVFTNGKWGFVDTTGTMRIQNEYSKVRSFCEDRAAVRIGDKWGFVDPNGRVSVPIIYDKVGDFENGRAAVFLAKEGWGFVNPDGTLIIPTAYEAVGQFKRGIVPVRQNNKWGLLNQFGALQTMLKYDRIGNYSEGLARVLVIRRVGVVNDKGQVLVEPNYDTVKRYADKVQVEVADKIGYIDLMGNWVWKPSK